MATVYRATVPGRSHPQRKPREGPVRHLCDRVLHGVALQHGRSNSPHSVYTRDRHQQGTQNMALLSISAAARAAGVDRATVYRALKSGKLSATVDDTGGKVIDTAELARVFTLRGTGETVTVTAPTGPDVLEQARQTEELVAVLRERVRGLEEQRELYRQQLQAAQTAMESLTLRLPPPAATQPAGSGLVWAVVGLASAIALGVAVVVLK